MEPHSVFSFKSYSPRSNHPRGEQSFRNGGLEAGERSDPSLFGSTWDAVAKAGCALATWAGVASQRPRLSGRGLAADGADEPDSGHRPEILFAFMAKMAR
jgi:hypothetical protein